MEIANRIVAYTIFDVGGSKITVGSLLLACAVMAAAFAAARLLDRGMSRVRVRMPDGGASLYILEKLGGYGLMVVGGVLALTSLGVNFSSLAVFAGALGVGVGLGLQGVVKEFVSGLVLLFDKILNVGDFIELPNGVRGVVIEIGTRATQIKSNDGVDILLPNSRLIEDQFINWTLKRQTRRIHVPFSVAYGTDKSRVRDVVVEAANRIPATLKETAAYPTQVWLVGFGDSALNFELVVWPTLEAVKRPAAMHAAYTWAIDDALAAAGIEIPFPQRDVRLRGVFGREGDEALQMIGHPTVARGGVATSPTFSKNDAADDLSAPQGEDLPETSA